MLILKLKKSKYIILVISSLNIYNIGPNFHERNIIEISYVHYNNIHTTNTFSLLYVDKVYFLSSLMQHCNTSIPKFPRKPGLGNLPLPIRQHFNKIPVKYRKLSCNNLNLMLCIIVFSINCNVR